MACLTSLTCFALFPVHFAPRDLEEGEKSLGAENHMPHFLYQHPSDHLITLCKALLRGGASSLKIAGTVLESQVF